MFALAIFASLLSGSVQAPNGRPIAQATVAVADRSAATTTTDADGKFSIDLTALPVDIEVSAPGFLTSRITVSTSPIAVILTPLAVTESVVVFGNAAPAWRDPSTRSEE